MSMRGEPELRALNERYFHALDQRDLDAVGECFAEDAVSVYLGGDWEFTGRDALVEGLAVIKSFASTIHVPTTMSFAADGEGATGTVFAIAYIAMGVGEAAKVVVRGLRYSDRYACEDAVWRISWRRQDPLWQYEVPTVRPEVPGQDTPPDDDRSDRS
jgi:hypothetical protein